MTRPNIFTSVINHVKTLTEGTIGSSKSTTTNKRTPTGSQKDNKRRSRGRRGSTSSIDRVGQLDTLRPAVQFFCRVRSNGFIDLAIEDRAGIPRSSVFASLAGTRCITGKPSFRETLKGITDKQDVLDRSAVSREMRPSTSLKCAEEALAKVVKEAQRTFSEEVKFGDDFWRVAITTEDTDRDSSAESPWSARPKGNLTRYIERGTPGAAADYHKEVFVNGERQNPSARSFTWRTGSGPPSTRF